MAPDLAGFQLRCQRDSKAEKVSGGCKKAALLKYLYNHLVEFYLMHHDLVFIALAI
jgi:hypothetical protein